MNTRITFAAGCLLLAAGASPSFAADIYVPTMGSLKDAATGEQVIVPEALAFQKSADWYIRGDLGVSRLSGFDTSGSADGTAYSVGGIDFDTVFSGSAGFGRYIIPQVRLGLDVEYRHSTDSRYSNGNIAAVAPNLTNVGTIPVELSTTSVMFNATYDFAPERWVSPYIGGSVGWAFHELKMKGSGYNNDVPAVDTDWSIAGVDASSNHFAAAVSTGLSFRMRQDLFVDVGYKFSYLGSADVSYTTCETSVPTCSDASLELEDLMSHEFKIGLRYDLY